LPGGGGAKSTFETLFHRWLETREEKAVIREYRSPNNLAKNTTEEGFFGGEVSLTLRARRGGYLRRSLMGKREQRSVKNMPLKL